MRILNIWFATAVAAMFWGTLAHAQSQRAYPDGKRGEVVLPLGELSFADHVIEYRAGRGRIKTSASDPAVALGAPDYSGRVTDGSFVSLGCGGTLVLQFTDNALVDRDGPDLYVFEVGPKVEGMRLDISANGSDWVTVGDISGGRADVDIGPVVAAGTTYRFVRLTDDNRDCGTNYAGADIDAVAAIGSALRYVLDGAVLFALDSSELRPEAQQALTELASDVVRAGVTGFEVIGHTDSSGSDDYNRALSQARALAVRDFMAGLPNLQNVSISAIGRGESEPVASNDTEAGRSENRRVEIIAASGR